MNGTNETLERQALDVARHAVTRRFPIPRDEIKKTVDQAIHLRDHAKEQKTQAKAIQLLVVMEVANQRDEIRAKEAEKPADGPGRVLGTVAHLHVTVAPEAFGAFLEDVRGSQAQPAALPPAATTVIEGTAERMEAEPVTPDGATARPVCGLRELPQAEQGSGPDSDTSEKI